MSLAGTFVGIIAYRLWPLTHPRAFPRTYPHGLATAGRFSPSREPAVPFQGSIIPTG